MSFTVQEILETVRMVELETLDIRTITLGINLLDCADSDLENCCEEIYAKIVHHARDLVEIGNGIAADFGVPIVDKRIATTPISLVAAASGSKDLASRWGGGAPSQTWIARGFELNRVVIRLSPKSRVTEPRSNDDATSRCPTNRSCDGCDSRIQATNPRPRAHRLLRMRARMG